MFAAALIPLMFILGLLVLFLFGAWPISIFPTLTVTALLVGLGIGLTRMLTNQDEEGPAHSPAK